MKKNYRHFSILNSQFSIQKGFTLIEVILVMSVAFVLLGISTVNLANFQRGSQLTATTNVLLADLKDQQIKAMAGATQGNGTAGAYGVHIMSDQYILFHGSTYNSSEPSNFVVDLHETLSFAAAPVDIIFQAGSGEIGSSSTITITDIVDSGQKTILLNRYGVVTGIN